MHCAAFHFIKALGVPSRVTRTGKRKCSGDGAEDDEGKNDEGKKDKGKNEKGKKDVDITMDVDASADDAESMALVVDFEPGDTVGKLLAFVNQVRMSSEGVREYLAHSWRSLSSSTDFRRNPGIPGIPRIEIWQGNQLIFIPIPAEFRWGLHSAKTIPGISGTELVLGMAGIEYIFF
jgi:hypothetical protein